MGEATSAIADAGKVRILPAIVKNIAVFAIIGCAWLGLETGYFSPDRPTRNQWELLERAKAKAAAAVIYQSNFALEKPGETGHQAGYWSRYNGATVSTVRFDPTGITINFDKAAWLGAVYRFAAFEPKAIYRVTMTGSVENEPAAMLVRNRQLDLMRQRIPVGTAPFVAEFVAPPGGLDRVDVVFMPDNRNNPKGTMKITSVKIERLGD